MNPTFLILFIVLFILFLLVLTYVAWRVLGDRKKERNLKLIFAETHAEDAQRFLALADTDKGGHLCRKEWIEVMTLFTDGDISEDECNKAFDVLDKDKNGQLHHGEMMEVMVLLQHELGLDKRQVSDMIDRHSANKKQSGVDIEMGVLSKEDKKEEKKEEKTKDETEDKEADEAEKSDNTKDKMSQ
jgi:hypothetical protein